jgi:hypothetical protein
LVTSRALAAADYVNITPESRQNSIKVTWIVRNIDKIAIDRPVEATKGRVVFELHSARRVEQFARRQSIYIMRLRA